MFRVGWFRVCWDWKVFYYVSEVLESMFSMLLWLGQICLLEKGIRRQIEVFVNRVDYCICLLLCCRLFLCCLTCCGFLFSLMQRYRPGGLVNDTSI